MVLIRYIRRKIKTAVVYKKIVNLSKGYLVVNFAKHKVNFIKGG